MANQKMSKEKIEKIKSECIPLEKGSGYAEGMKEYCPRCKTKLLYYKGSVIAPPTGSYAYFEAKLYCPTCEKLYKEEVMHTE